jgi:hypothetical protein
VGHRLIETVEARPKHIHALVPALRCDDLAEIFLAGECPLPLLYRLCRTSPIRRAVFIDGRIGAMWGCAGTLLSPVGEAWMLTTHEVERVPVAFLKTARQGIAEMLEFRSALISSVMASYERSIRFMRLLGFEVGEPAPIPPHGVLFCPLRLEA